MKREAGTRDLSEFAFERDRVGYILYTSDDIESSTLYRMAEKLIG